MGKMLPIGIVRRFPFMIQRQLPESRPCLPRPPTALSWRSSCLTRSVDSDETGLQRIGGGAVYCRHEVLMLAGNERTSEMNGVPMGGRLRVLALIAGIVLLHAPDLVAAPKQIHTKNSRFRIPYKFDAAALEQMNAREIQLYVSRNRGQTWDHVQSLPPKGGKFDYQAPAEDEYWFAVKTLDARNQLHPPRGTYETGLIVIVDQTSPVLELSLTSAAASKVELSWRASDPNLDPGSIRLEYLAPDARDWTQLDIPNQSSGEHLFSAGHAGVVSVRGSVSDLAGNVGESRTQLNLSGVGEKGLKLRPAYRGPIAGFTPDIGRSSVSSQEPTASLDHSADDQQYDGPIITPNGGLSRYQRQIPRSDMGVGLGQSTGVAAETVPFSTKRNEFANGVQASPQFISRQSAPDPSMQRRPPPRQRVVTSYDFQIGYKLDDVGPSGVSAVELFITEDNGRKWWKYGDDPDLKSPFDVKVRNDGVYGFAIRVSSGAGLTSDPPIPGEPPTIVVAVDQTPPIVELLPVQQGRGANANRVLIRWNVTEARPAEKPVSLYYAANLNGPWEPISGWKEELSGSFEWTVGPTVPTQFYIRVAARDAAGNVGKAESPQPIVVDLLRPTARIVDVEINAPSAPQ